MAENKQLRDNFAIPDNFGKNRENVRLIDREKIDDYKKLVRIDLVGQEHEVVRNMLPCRLCIACLTDF